MKELMLFDTLIKVTDDGLLSLTDMHRAAVKAGKANANNKSQKFFRLDQTKRFIKSMVKGDLKAPLKITKGQLGGTFGCKYLAYKYAGYLDPDFEVGVYNVVDKFFSGELQFQPNKELNDFVIRLRLSKEKGSIAGHALNSRKHEKKRLDNELVKLQDKYQMKIDFSA